MSGQGDDDVKTKSDSKSNAVSTDLDSKNIITNEASNKMANSIDMEQNTSNNIVSTSQPQKIGFHHRESMVDKATAFLVNLPKGKDFSSGKEFNFLRSKGLTDQEIKEAFRRASAICGTNLYNNFSGSLPPPVYDSYSNSLGVVQTSADSEGWFIPFLQSITYCSTVAFFGYYLYKSYIKKWLFGDKMSAVENRFNDLEHIMQRCMQLVEDKNISNQGDFNAQQRQIDLIQADLKFIKNFLISKNQFPSPNKPLVFSTKDRQSRTNGQKVVGSAETSNSAQQTIKLEPLNGPLKSISTRLVEMQRINDENASEMP